MLRERRSAVALLGALALLLVWNVLHFPWRNGYDATAAAHYAEALGAHHRLPHASETDVWHNPPLWFALAGAVYRAGEIVGLGDPGVPVQLLSALFVLGIVVLAGVLAHLLFPARRSFPLLVAAAAATTPVLVRAGVLFHPEPLAALLTTGALVAFVRAARQGAPTLAAGALTGLLVGLANLTRTWALAALVALVLGAVLLWRAERSRAAVRFGLALVGVAAALVVPWLAIKTAVYGSPLAYSQPDASQWRQDGRPAAFWTSLDVRAVLTAPYQPSYRNHLVPTVVTDWWGDYWRAYAVPPSLKDEPDRLPSRYARPLVRQSWVALAALAFLAVGAVGLVRRAWRDRDVALATVLASAVLLAVSFAAFLQRYPKQDGDNIKALYLLNAAPVVALALAWGVAAVWGAGRAGRVVATLVPGAAVLVSLSFLLLPPG